MRRNRAVRHLLLATTHAEAHSHTHATCAASIRHIAEHVSGLGIVRHAEAKVRIVHEPFPLRLLTCDTPLLHIVVRPVAIVQEHFGLHVIHVVVDINLVSNLLVVCIRFQIVVLQPIQHRFVIRRRTDTRFICTARCCCKKVNIVRVIAVLGFVIVFVVAFTQVVDTVILAIVIHDNITATLVINAQAIRHRSAHTVTHVIVAGIVTKVSEREGLELLEFRIIREQRVFQALFAILFAQGHSKGLLFFCAAVLARNFVVAHHAKCRSLRLARFKHFHINREFAIAPEVCAFFRIHHRSVITRHVKTGIGAEHRKRIRSHKECGKRGLLFENVSTDNFFARVRTTDIRTATQNHRSANRHRSLHYRRICSRFSTSLFATSTCRECRRHRRRVETRRRNVHFGNLNLFGKNLARRIAIRRRNCKAPLAGTITRPRSGRWNSTKTNRVQQSAFGIYKVQCTAILVHLERSVRFMAAIASNIRRNLNSR